MNWKTEKRKLKDLIPYEKNPRILTDKQKKEIEKSLKKFDLVEIPAINLDNKIIAGHQRVKILYELKGPEYEIEVRVPDKLLNENDFKEYLLRSNRNKADWDWEMINNDYDNSLLLESGFEEFEITIDSLNIDDCFKDKESIKKKVKVGKCEFCNKPLTTEVKIIKSSLDNYIFKEDNDLCKLIYEKIKGLTDKKIHIIIEE